MIFSCVEVKNLLQKVFAKKKFNLTLLKIVWNAFMARLFRLMYSDVIMNIIYIKYQFSHEELIAAITTDGKLASFIQKDIALFSLPEERSPWWKFSSQAKMSTSEEQAWKLIVEAFKLLNYQVPPANCWPKFEQIFNLSHLKLHAIH